MPGIGGTARAVVRATPTTGFPPIGSRPGPAQAPAPAPAPTPGAAQRAALLSPEPITAETPVDPGQATALSSAHAYSAGLSDMSADEITRALGRERDEISVGIGKEGEAAMGRGADPSLFRSRAVDAGARRLSDLHGKLTDIALGRKRDAIETETSAAESAAGLRNSLHLGTLSARLGEQRAATERAEVQARLQDAPYARLSDLMSRYGSLTSSSGPLTSSRRGPGGLGSPGGGYRPPASYSGPVWSRGSGIG